MALVLAFSVILSLFPVFKMPFGGSINLGEWVPIIFFSIKYGYKAGMNIGILYGLLKIFISFNIPPAQSVYVFIVVILFDYIIPYAFLGFSSFFVQKLKNKNCLFFVIVFISGIVKLFCTVVSGICVWKQYLPQTGFVFPFVFYYNLSYILPQTVICFFECIFISECFW